MVISEPIKENQETISKIHQMEKDKQTINKAKPVFVLSLMKTKEPNNIEIIAVGI